ncbi:Glycerophosphodiester phosphodiesterase domain-containing 4 [Gossypium arboreum]|uniref:Glycerophosphodiester phosphodiesterase domain-containing 4 n=1 Tax=Gossypium arboreum TaxID=29729 RepID=A0A0B0NUD4_GOSAR|nr:Glycerophosphodiester phosphodiesterase domain-containing 4 [Gossypium arboreum]
MKFDISKPLLNLRNSWDTNVMTLGLCTIPCKTTSETWLWHRYVISCKTIAGLSASIYDPMQDHVWEMALASIYDPIVAKLARGSKEVRVRFTLSN